MFVCVYVSMYACMHARTYIRTYVHTYIYICVLSIVATTVIPTAAIMILTTRTASTLSKNPDPVEGARINPVTLPSSSEFKRPFVGMHRSDDSSFGAMQWLPRRSSWDSERRLQEGLELSLGSLHLPYLDAQLT